MKTLYIIRHAKSSWKDLTLRDFDRPLNKRGERDAPFMGKLLQKSGVKPDVIISSPALRAKMTARLIAKEIEFNRPILYDENIYEADVKSLKNIIAALDDKYHIVFIFGHNPGMNMLVEGFVNFNDNIPTCGVIKLQFDCKKWNQINSKNAKFIYFDYPKKHK